jgi:hypothetical protein
LGKSAEDDDGDGASNGIFFQGFENFGTSHFGQKHIEKNEIGMVLTREPKGFLAIGGTYDGIAGAGESALRGDP